MTTPVGIGDDDGRWAAGLLDGYRRVLDVGNDKPFLSYWLQRFNPGTVFETISNAIPQTPFVLHDVDIESERFPYDDASFDQVIFSRGGKAGRHLTGDEAHPRLWRGHQQRGKGLHDC